MLESKQNVTVSILSKTNGIKNAYDIEAVPNPAEHTLTFLGNIQLNSHFRIKDLYGNILKTGDIDENSTIGITEINPGIYFLEIVSQSNETIFIKKISKR